MYKSSYHSPIGPLLLHSDGQSLTGIWVEGQKYYAATAGEGAQRRDDLDIFIRTRDWLDHYFQGHKPPLSELTLAPRGGAFRQAVWQILLEIPYGETMTYGEIAKRMAKEAGKEKMSARAVGGAVGHNPITIIIPCHRVMGAGGKLTGFASGLESKRWLLRHEGHDIREEIKS